MKQIFALVCLLMSFAAHAQMQWGGWATVRTPGVVGGVAFGTMQPVMPQVIAPVPMMLPQQQFYPPQLVARPVCAWPQEVLQRDVWGNIVGRSVVCR